MTIVVETVSLQVVTCGTCGITYGLPVRFVKELRRNHETFYCPNGHARYYPGESDIAKAERLRREAEAKLQRQRAEFDQEAALLRDEKERAERSAAAHKGAHTRTKNRVGKGVCPCCNRTFVNLARHMECKHPGYAHEDDVKGGG